MKKNILMAIIVFVLLTSCGGSGTKTTESNKGVSSEVVDTNLINVYYFHGKQRCKTLYRHWKRYQRNY